MLALWVVDVHHWVSHIMTEIRWYFGYRCEVIDGSCSWYYVVHVPRSHPVRVFGFGGAFVWSANDGWIIVEGGFHDRVGVLDEMQTAAGRLRSLQMEWDRLSPYEREYLIR